MRSQLQKIKLERLLSSILSVFVGFLSCFVFQIPLSYLVSCNHKLCFVEHESFMLQKRQVIKHQHRHYNNRKRGKRNLMKKNKKRKNNKNNNS